MSSLARIASQHGLRSIPTSLTSTSWHATRGFDGNPCSSSTLLHASAPKERGTTWHSARVWDKKTSKIGSSINKMPRGPTLVAEPERIRERPRDPTHAGNSSPSVHALSCRACTIPGHRPLNSSSPSLQGCCSFTHLLPSQPRGTSEAGLCRDFLSCAILKMLIKSRDRRSHAGAYRLIRTSPSASGKS